MTFVNASWHVHEDLFVDEGDDEDTRFGIPSSVSSSLCVSTTHAEPLRDANGRGGLQEHARHATKSGSSGKYVHVPHKDKPPQVVAKRNARERRRVQAVNSAFVRLRKAVPFENNRGKRVSKVKTLQYAIDYIQNLQDLLVDYQECQNVQNYYNYYSPPNDQQYATQYTSLHGYTDNFELSF